MTSNPTLPVGLHSQGTPFRRRVSHGGNRFASDLLETQPQDGAQEAANAAKVSPITQRRNPAVGAEPEDARLTGGTRSLFRRLMGLNVRPEIVPENPARAGAAPRRRLPQATEVVRTALNSRVA